VSERGSGGLPFDRPWARPEPGRLVGRGHTAGDFLEAWDWRVEERHEGFLRVRCRLPEHLKNPRGQLFGGFTPTYVDMVALFTVRSAGERKGWLATTNMRIDYFEPIVGPEFTMDSRLVKKRGRTSFVETRFLDSAGELAVFAVTTMRDVPLERPLGDV
jgi:acyl-coenzyme A thioesterase PaaI-like protein